MLKKFNLSLVGFFSLWQVNISLKHGKRLEHQGIRIEFVGQIGEFKQKGAFRCLWFMELGTCDCQQFGSNSATCG